MGVGWRAVSMRRTPAHAAQKNTATLSTIERGRTNPSWGDRPPHRRCPRRAVSELAAPAESPPARRAVARYLRFARAFAARFLAGRRAFDAASKCMRTSLLTGGGSSPD